MGHGKVSFHRQWTISGGRCQCFPASPIKALPGCLSTGVCVQRLTVPFKLPGTLNTSRSPVDRHRQPHPGGGEDGVGGPCRDQRGKYAGLTEGEQDGVDGKVAEADSEADADPDGDTARPSAPEGEGYAEEGHDEGGERQRYPG